MPAGEYSQITDIPGQANKGEAEALAGAGDVSLGLVKKTFQSLLR